MDWFRMYSEFAHDPKVQSMTEAMQRRLMMLLCLRCSNALVTLHETEIAFALRITDEDLAETKVLFLRKQFIDGAWEIMNWDKRQFVSDSSAPRVARHRAKLKSEAEKEAKQACNVTVAPQIQNRTEQIQKKDSFPEPQSGSGTESEESFVITIPLQDKTEFGITEAQSVEWANAYPAVDVMQQLRSMRQWCLANAAKRKTRRGIMGFCNSWLMKEQDKPRVGMASTPKKRELVL
jgi:hypothetical protein